MDGQRSMAEIWNMLVEADDDDLPTQPEIIRLLGQLHAADVLISDIAPDTAELLARYQRRRRSQRWQKLKTPLAIRIPLIDPDRLLIALLPYVRWMFNTFGAALWCAVVVAASVLAVRYWPDLSQNVTEKALAPQNLLLLWLTFPIVKALHEIGHAFAVKVWGGEVHEMGIMLLVLMPIPYVDASAASSFRERHRRIIVGAAGMLTEIFLAALALYVWLSVEPGLVRAIAYNVMLIAGVSTILFNGNPLLRFDGYYIFADWLEIPNLAARANRYVTYLIQRYAFGMKGVESPALIGSERPWFAFFAVASFIYRMFIYFVIILFIAGKFFFIGVILALWAAANMLLLPLAKSIWFVIASPRLRAQRVRALTATGAFAALLAFAVLVLPLPHFTRSEGIVWIPDESVVRTGTSGFAATTLRGDGQRVRAGEPILRFVDPILSARTRVVESQVEAARARRKALAADDVAKAQIADEEVERLQARLENFRQRADDLLVRSPSDGILHIPRSVDLEGRYFQQGEELAYVIGSEDPLIRVVLPQSKVDLVRQKTGSVEVRFADSVDKRLPAQIRREVPAATDQLPSPALGMVGGGDIANDPRGVDGNKALENIFLFDLEIDPSITIERLGGRVYVRFDHGREALAFRWYRELRQLLLGRFDV